MDHLQFFFKRSSKVFGGGGGGNSWVGVGAWAWFGLGWVRGMLGGGSDLHIGVLTKKSGIAKFRLYSTNRCVLYRHMRLTEEV